MDKSFFNFSTIIFVLIVAIIFIGIYIVIKKLNNNKIPPGTYHKKYLMSKPEYNFYFQLRKVTDNMDLLVFPKVGLKDFVSVSNKRDYTYYFRKISQKHVDFLICTENLQIVCAIELDDKSHLSKDAYKNDSFKNELYKKIKLPLIRVKTAKSYDQNYLKNMINSVLN